MAPHDRSLLSSRSVGDLNRARVLRTLTDVGPLSRSQLAQLAGVARASIGTIVQGLLDDGLLVEHEPQGSGRSGKPARPLWFAPGAGTVLALDLRHTEVRAARVDARGEAGPLTTVAIGDPTDPKVVRAAVRRAARRLAEGGPAIGVGVCLPGACDPSTGVVHGSYQVPGAEGDHLHKALADALGLPAHVDNDSRAQALAEHWFGAGRGRSTFVSLQVGEGIGAGLVLDGVVHRGPAGWSGEVGHLPLAVDHPVRCDCGKDGCWETLAALRWLRAAGAERGLAGPGGLDTAALVALVADGSADAAEVLARWADHLALGLAGLNHLLEPELVILHGDVVAGGATFLEAVQAATDHRTLRPVEVVLSALPEPTLLGAAARVLAEELHRSGADVVAESM